MVSSLFRLHVRTKNGRRKRIAERDEVDAECAYYGTIALMLTTRISNLVVDISDALAFIANDSVTLISSGIVQVFFTSQTCRSQNVLCSTRAFKLCMIKISNQLNNNCFRKNTVRWYVVCFNLYLPWFFYTRNRYNVHAHAILYDSFI